MEFFWFLFSCIRTEYGDLFRKSPYSVPMQESSDQKKTRYLDPFPVAITLSVMCICTCLRCELVDPCYCFQFFPLFHLELFYHPVYPRICDACFQCITETSTCKFFFSYMEPSWVHFETIFSYIYQKNAKTNNELMSFVGLTTLPARSKFATDKDFG